MSEETQVHNLLTGTRDWSGSWMGIKNWKTSGTVGGFSVISRDIAWGGVYEKLKLEAGKTYSFSAMVRAPAGKDVFIFVTKKGADGILEHAEVDVYYKDAKYGDGEWHQIALTFTPRVSKYAAVRVEIGDNGYAVETYGWMLVEGDTPAAWAPAEGETLAGVGTLMSANLWKAESVTPAGIPADGIYACSGTRGVRTNVALDRLAENQTFHCGFSVNPGADEEALNVALLYKDAAGSVNYAFGTDTSAPAGKWTRVSGSVVVPSGMTVYQMVICNEGNASGTSGWKVMNPTLSLGSPVCLASSAHTPYATQDHVSVTYATKASLKVTDDSIKTEVSARAQTDRNVADLSSRLTQTANSLTSEISDRKSAITTVTGLANAAQSTADGAAKQANLYTIGLGDAGAVAKWIHLGTLTSAGDSSSATIAIVFGNGYNGSAGQNSAMTITIKDGYQNPQSATKACGVTAMRENCDDALVDVLAQSARVYDVWVYAPWPYSNGRYSVSGQYAAWQHSGATQEDEPATSATQVKQDVAYRLADATKAQTMATENKSSIRQLSDSITSEVTERSKLAGKVGTLESTSGTHASRLAQLAASITSLVKGESTYTDPDGASATSGIYSLVTQTRDSVTALFGDYTKTEDLAATDAVKDAKKAGTDAQAAASAAQTTADSASSTAGAAKSTADSLATMVRQYSGGVLVCKVGQQVGALVNADGSFDVADVTWDGETPTAGKKLMRLAKNSIEFNNPDTSYNICNITANGTLTNIYVPNGSLAIDEMPAWCQAIGDSGYDSFIAGKMLQLGAGNRRTHSEILIEPDGTTIDGYKFALGTNNTTDTWVPVMGGNSNAGHLVHRVINLKWGPNAYAVYGAYNPNNGGDHYYTTNVNEYNKLIKSGWTGSGVYFYAAL